MDKNNLSNEANILNKKVDDLEDYKEIKELVKNLENGISIGSRKYAPARVAVRNKR